MQPKIRFNNFFSNWYKSKLDEHVSFFSGLTYSPDDVQEKEDGVLVLRSSNIQNNNIVYDDNVYVNKDVVNTSYVRSGDIILVVRNGSKRLIGKHALIHSYMKDTVIGAFMTGIRAKNYYFINALLDSYSFQKQIYKNLGATINQITNRDLHNMCFFFPDSLDEQKKVGYFFSILDQIIEQADQQLKQYQSLKKGLLQKLFPQGKEDVPQVRFIGFNDKWIIKKLLDISKLKTGSKNVQDNDIHGKYVFFDRSIQIKNINEYDYDEETIIYPGEGSSFLPRYFNGKYALHQRSYSIYDFSECVIPKFLYELLLTKSNDFIRYSVGTTVSSLRRGTFERIIIKLPEYDEQKKISNLLEKLDKLIELQEKKVNNLKQLKQGLLQQMFC